MKYNLYDWLKIRHYESSIQDVDAFIVLAKRTKNKRKERILNFIKDEYKRRIKFYKGLDKLEKK